MAVQVSGEVRVMARWMQFVFKRKGLGLLSFALAGNSNVTFLRVSMMCWVRAWFSL